MYELTDARIADIIAPRTVDVTLPIRRAPAPTYQEKQLQTSLYKKYGGDSGDDDNDNDDNDHGDDAIPIITATPPQPPQSSQPQSSEPPQSPQSSQLSDPPQSPPYTTKNTGLWLFPHPQSTNVTANASTPAAAASANNQLFWCFYIAHVGLFAYDTMVNSFVTENAFKYATIDHISANVSRTKAKFKQYKISLPNFEAELVSGKCVTLQTMMGLALCYERNVLYIDNRKYFEIVATDETDPFTVIEKVKNRFCVWMDDADVKADVRTTCHDKFWKMETIANPLKAISNYKLAELQDIYARLKIEIKQNSLTSPHPCKKLTKPELYAAIVQNI